MTWIKDWCFSLCVSLLCAVLFSLFTPSGRMKRFYKILIAVFIFSSLLLPLQGKSISSFSLPEWKESETAEDAAVQPYEAMLNEKVKAVLTQAGITGVTVSSSVQLDTKNGNLAIERVTVAVPDACDRERVKSALLNALGIHAEVIGVGD